MQKPIFCLSLIAASLCANAQTNDQETQLEDVERIVVSGDFRETVLDQLSASATILGAKRLSSRQPTHIDSVLNSVPNLSLIHI